MWPALVCTCTQQCSCKYMHRHVYTMIYHACTDLRKCTHVSAQMPACVRLRIECTLRSCFAGSQRPIISNTNSDRRLDTHRMVAHNFLSVPSNDNCILEKGWWIGQRERCINTCLYAIAWLTLRMGKWRGRFKVCRRIHTYMYTYTYMYIHMYASQQHTSTHNV